MEQLEIRDDLDDLDEKINDPNKYPRSAKVTIILLSVFLSLFAIALIVLVVFYIKTENERDDLIIKTFVGEISIGINYANDTIENTFKEGGKNYQVKIGNVNDGRNYEKIKDYYNIYDLYIPYSALKEKKTKGILVFVHGGAWTGGKLYDVTHMCNIYYQYEYTVVNLNYTLLNHNNTNIFRQLDEISACIEHAKKTLVSKGFKESELQVAIGGGSAGGHLSLLYAYLVKDPPLPVRFVHIQSAPVNLEIDDFLCIKEDKDTLPDLEPSTVNEAIKKNHYPQPWTNDFAVVQFLMKFDGLRLSDNEINNILVNNKINKTDKNYEKIYNIAKWGFPTNWMEGKNIPILVGHGGRDDIIGFVQYTRLKEAAIKNKNTIETIYSRYGGHGFYEFEHEEGRKASKDYHNALLKFCDQYFQKY